MKHHANATIYKARMYHLLLAVLLPNAMACKLIIHLNSQIHVQEHEDSKHHLKIPWIVCLHRWHSKLSWLRVLTSYSTLQINEGYIFITWFEELYMKKNRCRKDFFFHNIYIISAKFLYFFYCSFCSAIDGLFLLKKLDFFSCTYHNFFYIQHNY